MDHANPVLPAPHTAAPAIAQTSAHTPVSGATHTQGHTLALERGAPDYPPRLLNLSRPPGILYVRGSPEALRTPQVAIVGARSASAAGLATAHAFAVALARAGLTVTSGLALGVDSAAHEGALAGSGRTIALCAQGLDRVYPTRNAGLARRIMYPLPQAAAANGMAGGPTSAIAGASAGALASIHPDGTGARRQHFPARNALISALSLAVLVVEAQPGSGSLITASQARTQGRPVFAVPGSIRDPLAAGCNQLIRAGATAVTCPAELLSDLGWKPSFHHEIQILENRPDPPGTPSPARPSLDKPLEMLLDAAGFEPASIDLLAGRTGFSASAVASMLLVLELGGRIAPQPGGRYRRLT